MPPDHMPSDRYSGEYRYHFLSLEAQTIDQINITSFTCDDGFIYTLSNINQVTCADRLALSDPSDSALDTVKLEEIYLDSAAAVDGILYTFAYGEDDLCALYGVDFERGEARALLDLDSQNPPCFLVAYGRKLLFTFSGVLCIYDTQTGTLEEKPLCDERAYNLSLSGDILAIGYTSILSLEDSLIELYDLKNEKTICQFAHTGSILQIEMPHPWNGEVYVLGYDDLTVYSVREDPKKGMPAAEMVCSLGLAPEDNEYCGGFLLMK